MSKKAGSMILLPIKICNFGLFGSSIASIFYGESNKSMHFDKLSEKCVQNEGQSIDISIRNNIALIWCACVHVCCVVLCFEYPNTSLLTQVM